MATANSSSGAPRIHGELRAIGIQVSERTVSRLLAPHTRPSPTWKTFLTNHLASAAAMDFFAVPTLTVTFNVIRNVRHARHCPGQNVSPAIVGALGERHVVPAALLAVARHRRPQRGDYTESIFVGSDGEAVPGSAGEPMTVPTIIARVEELSDGGRRVRAASLFKTCPRASR
jgi:hypothetical protein